MIEVLDMNNLEIKRKKSTIHVFKKDYGYKPNV